MNFKDIISEKLNHIIDISKPNVQMTNYAQHQIEKMTTYIIQNEVILQNNGLLDINDPQRSQFQFQLHPDMPPILKFGIESNNALFNPPNQFVLTQAVIQGISKQEISTEKDRVKQKLAGFDVRKSPACIYISSHFGSDVHQQTLCKFAKKIAKKNKIILDRDSKRRKALLFKWFHDHWDIIRTDFENAQLLDDTLVINDSNE